MDQNVTAPETAMTEIALALAMGFFSIMVLTMISMGAADSRPERPDLPVLAMVPPAEPGHAAAERTKQDDFILIFDGTRYLDTSLSPVDPDHVVRSLANSGRRLVLALDPALPVKAAMDARLRLRAPDLVVTSLDERWRRALSGKGASHEK